MNEPSTSTHQFQRYIWEDFSARRARNRAQSDRDNKDWNNAPGKYFYWISVLIIWFLEAPEDHKPDYVIGPGEIRQQLLAQTYYGKGEQTTTRQNIKPPKKKYTTPRPRPEKELEKEREKVNISEKDLKKMVISGLLAGWIRERRRNSTH